MKARRRKTARPSRRKQTPTRRSRDSSTASLKKRLGQRTRERDEALERETATSEVLRVISSSPGELEPVFQAMLANATRICGAEFGNMFLREGDTFRAVAVHGPPSTYAERYRREPLLDPNCGTRRSRALPARNTSSTSSTCGRTKAMPSEILT